MRTFRRPQRLPVSAGKYFLLLALIGVAACGTLPGSLPSLEPPLAAPTQLPTVAPPTLTPTVTPTPMPSLTRLTEPGCCTQLEWSPDSTQIRFVDQPPAQPVGLYAVGLEGGPPTLVSQRLGEYSPDGRFIAYPENRETFVEEVGTGQRWMIDNGGLRVIFSPGSTRLVWTEETGGGGFDTRAIAYHVTSVQGQPVGEPLTLYGGGFSGWLDENHLLVAGKSEPDGERALYSLSVLDGALFELARGERVRSGIPSPGGALVVYLVLFDQDNPERDGFWVVSADGQTHYQLDLFGPIQWRDSEHFLLVPQEMGASSHRIVEIEAPTGEVRPLTDPSVTPFVIEGGDWQVSPDGRYVAYVSSDDRAIWLLNLP